MTTQRRPRRRRRRRWRRRQQPRWRRRVRFIVSCRRAAAANFNVPRASTTANWPPKFTCDRRAQFSHRRARFLFCAAFQARRKTRARVFCLHTAKIGAAAATSRFRVASCARARHSPSNAHFTPDDTRDAASWPSDGLQPRGTRACRRRRRCDFCLLTAAFAVVGRDATQISVARDARDLVDMWRRRAATRARALVVVRQAERRRRRSRCGAAFFARPAAAWRPTCRRARRKDECGSSERRADELRARARAHVGSAAPATRDF